MKQISKFYLSSFLKNQTYFTPIMIIFLQFNNLSYTEIFWVYTIASISNIVLEIPTGILADLFGKKKTMILSRFFTLTAFVMFGFSSEFYQFVIAQLLITLGESFKSGTDVAYIFDYLEQSKSKTGYTEVKGKQKFWARIGEAIATSIGGFIAKFLGFNAVFFFAAVPALLHLILVMTFENIKESGKSKKVMKSSLVHFKSALKEVNKPVFIIIMNIALYITVLAGIDKFLQPYMQDVGIDIQWFGIIYAVFFVLTAVAVRYSYILERRYKKGPIINFLTFLAIIPLLILGFGYVSIYGVILFFILVMAENVRSPIANHEFHTKVSSKRRATLGSILMMSRNLGKAIFLPLFGFLADSFSMQYAILVMAGIMFINFLFFRLDKLPDNA